MAPLGRHVMLACWWSISGTPCNRRRALRIGLAPLSLRGDCAAVFYEPALPALHLHVLVLSCREDFVEDCV